MTSRGEVQLPGVKIGAFHELPKSLAEAIHGKGTRIYTALLEARRGQGSVNLTQLPGSDKLVGTVSWGKGDAREVSELDDHVTKALWAMAKSSLQLK